MKDMTDLNTLLLIVDPQNDFCDPRGSLYVPGAQKDMERLADFIKLNRTKIDHIEVTLDSHNWIHIAHPIFWINSKGEQPKPFTIIELEDVIGPDPHWHARHLSYQERAIDYVKKLKESGQYELTIWPPHCLIGTWGHDVYPCLMDALHSYEETFSSIHYSLKGSNPLTEHYSAIKAEIPHPEDLATEINKALLDKIKQADRVVIAGEALSHCVANTVKDIAKSLGQESLSKWTLLVDASSNVKGFEHLGKDFLTTMEKLQVQIEDTQHFKIR